MAAIRFMNISSIFIRSMQTQLNLYYGNKKAPSGGPEGALVFLQPWLALKL